MNLYDKYILPKVTHMLCSLGPVMKQRAKVVPGAEGRVLEIGIGSGLNLPYYNKSRVDHLFGLDPSKEMWSRVKDNLPEHGISVEFLRGYAEDIPLDDASVDTIVMTYTLCTITDSMASLTEMRRVLRPNGKLLFCEHGAAPDKAVVKWQNRLNPVWKRLGGGCNLNRKIPELIKTGGFKFSKIETMYIPGFKPAFFNYWGVAKPI